MRKPLIVIAGHCRSVLNEVRVVFSNALRVGPGTEDKETRINQIVGNRCLAVVGVSRSRFKFGHRAYRELKKRGYTVYAINKSSEPIGGEVAYASLAELPERPSAVLLITPPDQTEALLQQCSALGIDRAWIQQGAESETAIQYCIKNHISFVAHECVLMHAPPVCSYHLLHRRIREFWGGLRSSIT